MSSTTITIRVYTAAGTSASSIGNEFGAYDGVSWRNAVDQCDSDGGGRVFLDCDDPDTAGNVVAQLMLDERVTDYEVM